MGKLGFLSVIPGQSWIKMWIARHIEEDQAMLAEFWEFDRKRIHEKYRSLVESLGG